jgi:hypothetical protein
MMSVYEMPQTDDMSLCCMAEAIDAFVAQQVSLGELVGRLATLHGELRLAPPKWQAIFLNLCTSLEIIHTEVRVHRRELTEMELRFVLSLSLELKDMIVAVRGSVTEPLAASII